MDKNSKIEKEVSCKPLPTIIDAARNKNIELSKILDGIPYELSYLYNKHERIEWMILCKLISNIKAFFTINEFIELGKNFVKKESYIEGFIFFSILFSSNKLTTVLKKQLSKEGLAIIRPIYSCVSNQVDFIDKNKTRLHIDLFPGYSHCPEMFYMSIGVLEMLGSRTAKKGFKVDFTLTTTGGIYDVSWDEVGFTYKLKSWLRWLFNIRKAFTDLTESHDELLENYNKLEESKKLLQRQTTQLKTAYNITRSIRQSLDVTKTLNTITSALVNDAGVSSGKIKIFKDIEGNTFEAEASSGTAGTIVNPIKHPIVIDNDRIGELIVFPKADADVSELNELLNYLLPIINISIHDSLVLRAITDYKDNLETKVNERTAELKKAQDKLSDIIRLQNHFFTNISHEFRTPLTLILGPSRQILEETENQKIKDEVNLIYRNAKKLNMLANQLLDISRIEAGKMKLKTSEQNLVPIIKRIIYSFQSFAERKHISLNFKAAQKEIVIYIDEEKIDKIISNLLSNALKFTQSGGSVSVNIYKNDNNVEISVSDNGIGIPKEQFDKIYDRFYQVDNKLSKEYEGTGVGLSLTKELVELHKGKISVESEEGVGSIFRVSIPLGKEHLLSCEIAENFSEGEIKTKDKKTHLINDSTLINHLTNNTRIESFENKSRPVLLIIEDNSDVRKYIRGILADNYMIEEADNGEEGAKKSFELIPELIISDIMMPKLDGIQLCQSLKSDTRTSHIPIILLTARVTLNDKIEGLQTGADDYIMKPFEAEELKARIKNLLEQRNRIHEHFQKFEIIIDKDKITSLDQKFIQQTITLINEHLSNSNFSVEELAENLAVSRSLLHKKLVVLLGEPPREIIKRIRLNKAAKLIEQKSGNISEIALEVGFNNPSYFAECFQKQFGFNPSHYHHNTMDNK